MATKSPDPTTWATLVGVVLAIPAALITSIKGIQSIPQLRARWKEWRLRKAHEFIAKDQLEQAIPGVVSRFPEVATQLDRIEEALKLTQEATEKSSAKLDQVAHSLETHTSSDEQQFSAVQGGTEALGARFQAVEQAVEKIPQLERKVDDLSAAVKDIADLRDFVRQGLAQGDKS